MVRKPKMSSDKEVPAGEPTLAKLYFGKDDAESDFARGGLLKQGFLRTRAFDEALNGGKSLIIGRKGSGKSAICLMLRDKLSAENRCSLITPDEISADEIRRFQLPGIPPEQSKQLIWRYVFLVQISKFILSESKKSVNQRNLPTVDVNAIRKFLKDNGESEDFTLIDRFWKIIERLKGSVSIEAFTVKLKLDGGVEPPSAGAKAHESLDVVERHLSQAARILEFDENHPPFHLLVDQIEKVWSNDRESDAMVVGLLLAAKSIQSSFDFVFCTVFLRKDIYEQLQFQDRDKLRGDEFHIDWDESSLLNLILTRAEASLNSPISPDRFWKSLFPAQADSQPCKKFLISRTLMRPRDIIQLCNACRDVARNNQRETITESDIRKALALYSSWKLNDLQNEWSVNYPFLPDAFLLLSNSSYMISRNSMEDALGKVKSDLTARYPNMGQALNPHTFLSILYSIGLIGLLRDGKTLYSFGRSEDDDVRVTDNDFVIHPCFRNALQSVSALKLSPFEAETERTRSSRIYGLIGSEAKVRGFQTIRGTRGTRAFSYISENVDQLSKTVMKSNLPDELRSEVHANVTAMMQEISQIDEYDELATRDVLHRIFRHLTRLADRLDEGRWLAKEKNLTSAIYAAVEQLERFIYRGDLREFSA